MWLLKKYDITITDLETWHEEWFILLNNKNTFSIQTLNNWAQKIQQWEITTADLTNNNVFEQYNWSWHIAFETRQFVWPDWIKYRSPSFNYSQILPTWAYWKWYWVDTITQPGEIRLWKAIQQLENNIWERVQCYCPVGGDIYLWMRDSAKIYRYYYDWTNWTYELAVDLTDKWYNRIRSINYNPKYTTDKVLNIVAYDWGKADAYLYWITDNEYRIDKYWEDNTWNKAIIHFSWQIQIEIRSQDTYSETISAIWPSTEIEYNDWTQDRRMFHIWWLSTTFTDNCFPWDYLNFYDINGNPVTYKEVSWWADYYFKWRVYAVAQWHIWLEKENDTNWDFYMLNSDVATIKITTTQQIAKVTSWTLWLNWPRWFMEYKTDTWEYIRITHYWKRIWDKCHMFAWEARIPAQEVIPNEYWPTSLCHTNLSWYTFTWEEFVFLKDDILTPWLYSLTPTRLHLVNQWYTNLDIYHFWFDYDWANIWNQWFIRQYWQNIYEIIVDYYSWKVAWWMYYNCSYEYTTDNFAILFNSVKTSYLQYFLWNNYYDSIWYYNDWVFTIVLPSKVDPNSSSVDVDIYTSSWVFATSWTYSNLFSISAINYLYSLREENWYYLGVSYDTWEIIRAYYSWWRVVNKEKIWTYNNWDTIVAWELYQWKYYVMYNNNLIQYDYYNNSMVTIASYSWDMYATYMWIMADYLVFDDTISWLYWFYNTNKYVNQWYLISSIYDWYVWWVDKTWTYAVVRTNKQYIDKWQKIRLAISYDQWQNFYYLPKLLWLSFASDDFNNTIDSSYECDFSDLDKWEEAVFFFPDDFKSKHICYKLELYRWTAEVEEFVVREIWLYYLLNTETEYYINLWLLLQPAQELIDWSIEQPRDKHLDKLSFLKDIYLYKKKVLLKLPWWEEIYCIPYWVQSWWLTITNFTPREWKKHLKEQWFIVNIALKSMPVLMYPNSTPDKLLNS